MAERNLSFQRILWATVGGLLAGLVVIIILLHVIQKYGEFNDQAASMRAAFVEQQKQMIKREVDRIVERIAFERRQIGSKASALVAEHVRQAYGMLENLHQEQVPAGSPESIKRLFIDVLRPLRVFQEQGDFFILDLKGRILLATRESRSDDKSLPALRNEENPAISAALLELARQKGEGMLRYSGSQGELVAYVKRFAPYGWILGSTISIRDLEADIQKKLLDDIAKVRYGKNGYIFIDNWQGVVLAHGAQPDLVGQNIWDYQDSHGVKVVQDLIAAAQTAGGDYVFYSWRKPDTGEERPKVSYSRGVHDWQWMIGTGVYIDDIETDIAILHDALRAGLRQHILWLLLVSGTVGLLLLLFVQKIFRHLLRDFSRFDTFFHEAAFADREIELAGLTFSELRDMAQSANKMLRDKVAAQERLRKHRDHLEEEVAERTQALQEKNQQLEQAKEAAEAANRAKTVFLANMSHELRTPLNAVLGFTQMLKNSRNVTAEQRESLEIITRSGEHLLNLINNVLDISKIESGRIELEEAPCALHQFLEEIRTIMSSQAAAKGLLFSLERNPELPRRICVDAGKLRQVLINLIGNAVKYTVRGGVVLRVRGDSPDNAEQVRLRFEVEDSGPGIREEDRLRIFAPFVHLGEDSAGDAGTGLGLSICKQYVELMGGEIGVGDAPSGGALFYFTLAAAVLPAEESPLPAEHGKVVGLAAGTPAHRLLLVEDQAESRLLLRRLLSPLGFELKEAVNGEEALALWRDWRPQLIFMDMRMPVMDGLEATRRIKAADREGRTRIVAITAHALEEERREILAAGCDDFIRKPYYNWEIYDSLSRQLGVRFRYEEALPVPDEENEPALTADELARLPRELTDELYAALELLDSARILEVVSRIERQDPALGSRLQRIAEKLQYRVLLNALECRLQTGESDG
ncbi:MAG: cache domain-containing protein [Desulfuromonadaceae bacterium]